LDKILLVFWRNLLERNGEKLPVSSLNIKNLTLVAECTTNKGLPCIGSECAKGFLCPRREKEA
jgi:hypothetical protein